jgi:N6-L-threonylcarbamoyladenine synthase
LYQNRAVLILGLETSCDDTGAALYDGAAGRLLGHLVHAQSSVHAPYGGVVPELASRDHVRRLLPLCHELFRKTNKSIEDLGVIAYTEGPGLAGALLVGASFARALALALGARAVGIHHLEAHLLSPLLAADPPQFPFVALLVSGGHTQLMRVEGVGRYALLGETHDDAAGEAFDKAAKLLGLGYPGGPALAELAKSGAPGRYRLPRPMLASGDLDFSFSGLKTALLLLVKGAEPNAQFFADAARAFEDAIVEVLTAKCAGAMERAGLARLVLAGGVAANARLRAALGEQARQSGFRVFYPEPELCTDNGAMIAHAAALRLRAGLDAIAGGSAFSVRPRWELPVFS